MSNHTAASATRDLETIRTILERTERQVDPHAFHFVHWGLIVLLWYPVANVLQWREEYVGLIIVSGVALLVGGGLSAGREIALGRRPRVPGENTFIARQVCWIVYGSLVAGFSLSFVAPATDFIPGPFVPVIWGFVYATMTYMIGVIYKREFLWAGAFIFLGTLVSLVYADYCGIILGPVMGFGTIVPGLIAERRVSELKKVADEANYEPV